MENHLQAENQYLRRQLQLMLSEARENEDKLRRFDQLERRIIATHSLAGLMHTLLQDYKTVFDLDAVTLMLADPECEAARILGIMEEINAGGGGMPGLILLHDTVMLEALYDGAITPFLGAYDAARHGALFVPSACTPASVGLLPLTHQGVLVGSLNMGSCAPERFTDDSGTNFLERLAAIAAICLENALNHERLKLVGLTDPLTGINNRRYFEHRCLEEVAYACRHELPLACLFLDADKFKRINDLFGHQAGDAVLKRIAALIKSQLRASDIPARYGGEEFVVLLPQTTLSNACDVAERIRCAIEAQPFQTLPGASIPITISIGISMLATTQTEKEVGILAEKLIAGADEALYRAKKNGRNQVVVSEG
ncbi:MAG: sensor domain-containing diguanylate cyclase [Sulfuricellaceae bacterium]